jgi:hypothetical protein
MSIYLSPINTTQGKIMPANKNKIFKNVFRVIAILVILGMAWVGFIWLTQAPPVDALPSLLMVWATAIVLLLAFFPSVLNRVGRLKVGEVELELQNSVQSANIQSFIPSLDLSAAYLLTLQGNAGGLQNILAKAIETAGKPILFVIDLQEQKITRAFLFAFLMLIDLFSDRVIVAFSAPHTRNPDAHDINIEDLVGLVSGKRLLNAYHRRFPSLVNIFIRDKEISTTLEMNGLVQIPSSELIMGLYDQCRAQIAHDLQIEKGRYTGLEHPEMDEALSQSEIETWLAEILNRRIVEIPLQSRYVEIIYQTLNSKEDYLLVSSNGKFKSALLVDEFSRVIANKVIGQLFMNKG